jgi:hypothetical protein
MSAVKDPSIILSYTLRQNEDHQPSGAEGFPQRKHGHQEWIHTGTVPQDEIIPALRKDGVQDAANHASVASPRAHYEILFGYLPPQGTPKETEPYIPSVYFAGIVGFLTTSRGSIMLASADAATDPVIDPNYFATQHDWAILRNAARVAMSVMSTDALKEHIEGAIDVKGFELRPDSTDEQIDAHVKAHSSTFFHPGGTAAMGKVVDTECRVQGVRGLRVVDASILPLTVGAHYQGV